MLKNLILFTVGADMPGLDALSDRLASMAFVPCAPTQPMARGFVPPREEHGAMIEAVDGHWLLALKTEQRILPPSVIKDYVDELADTIEEQTGRRPRGKAMRELKEQAVHELLPKSFMRSKVTRVWIDPKDKRIAIDSATEALADDVITLLVEASGTPMNLAKLNTAVAPASAMRAWLMQGAASGPFSLDREGELRQPDSEKAVVRYQRHPLDTEEVRQHVSQGKDPVKLALTFDGRVSFLLTHSLHLKRVATLDIPLESDGTTETADKFDADMAIFTGEVSRLLDALVQDLGGLYELPIEAAAKAPVHLEGDGPDPMLDQARAVVLEHRRASISLVQRYLRIGYNRAARLLEALEAEGTVSAMQSDGNRTITTGDKA